MLYTLEEELELGSVLVVYMLNLGQLLSTVFWCWCALKILILIKNFHLGFHIELSFLDFLDFGIFSL